MKGAVCALVLLCVAEVGAVNYTEQLGGWYVSETKATPLGPGVPMVWSIRQIDAATGEWLMEDAVSGEIATSHQQFWVRPRDGTLAYCGLLRHFFQQGNTATVYNVFYKNEALSSPTTITWCADSWTGGCKLLKWVMTVDEQAKTVTMIITMGTATHASFTLVKKGPAANPDAGYASIPVADRRTCRLQASKIRGYNFNKEGVPSDNIPGSHPSHAEGAATEPRKSDPATAADSNYTFCTVVNQQTALTVQWKVIKEGFVDKRGPVVAMKVSGVSQGYVAIGFYPSWPGMQDGRILLGAPGCGVRQFVAEEYVGEPKAVQWTNVTDVSVGRVGQVTSFEATFELPAFPTPNPSSGEIMWAVGPTDPSDSCRASYHSQNRGVFDMRIWTDAPRTPACATP